MEVEEDSETLDYILGFLYPQPVQPRALEFPRDWKVIRAFEKYSVSGDDSRKKEMSVSLTIGTVEADLARPRRCCQRLQVRSLRRACLV